MTVHLAVPSDAINWTALRMDVRRAIATAKIAEFENQAFRLGHIISTGLLGRAAAAELLLDVAVGNGLVREHGDEFIQQVMVEGIGGGI